MVNIEKFINGETGIYSNGIGKKAGCPSAKLKSQKQIKELIHYAEYSLIVNNEN